MKGDGSFLVVEIKCLLTVKVDKALIAEPLRFAHLVNALDNYRIKIGDILRHKYQN